jgi:deoxycytidylate deaminase
VSFVWDNIDVAGKIAREIDNGMRSFHCALVCDKRKILSVGINSRQTHPRAPRTERGQKLHAEVAAIIGADRGALRGSVLYVVRVGKSNSQAMRMSKPCAQCQAAIIKAGIKAVYYSINNCRIGHWDVRKDDWIEVERHWRS